MIKTLVPNGGWSCIVKGAFRKGSIKMFIFPGGSVALYMATVKTGLGLKIASNFGDSITGMGWEVGLLIVVILAAFLGTIMSGTAAQAMYMPLIINMVISQYFNTHKCNFIIHNLTFVHCRYRIALIINSLFTSLN